MSLSISLPGPHPRPLSQSLPVQGLGDMYLWATLSWVFERDILASVGRLAQRSFHSWEALLLKFFHCFQNSFWFSKTKWNACPNPCSSFVREWLVSPRNVSIFWAILGPNHLFTLKWLKGLSLKVMGDAEGQREGWAAPQLIAYPWR